MKKGFTLIELMVIIAIIGVLSSVVIASIGAARSEMQGNYKINFGNQTHYVESYTKESQGKCVYIAEKELRLCGDWSVEKLKKDKEEEY